MVLSQNFILGMVVRTMSCAFCLTILRLFFVVGSSGYKDCVSHYFRSSCKVAHSAVQPGTVSDLIEIVSKSFSLVVEQLTAPVESIFFR